MFHQGDLQSGITRAIQEEKVVVCFVRDGGSESRTWEEEYLAKQPLSGVLDAKSVILRIELGSQEASFLAAFCPVAQAPTLAIINNGQLRECLTGGINYDELSSRLTRAIDPTAASTGAHALTEPPPSSTAPHTAIQSDGPEQEPIPSSINTPPPSASESAHPNPPSLDPPPNVQALLQERRVRLEAERKEKEEKEKAERQAKAQARRDAADAAAAGQANGARPAEANYAAQERKRKQEDRIQRERIRQLLENDKKERKEREARTKETLAAVRQARQAEAETRDGPSSSTSIPTGTCAVQVRLFDGSTIRTRFDSPTTQTLVAVRKWVDLQLQSADGVKPSSIPPYTFKQILTPQPNRTLEVGEEEKTLQELDLAPTATLVLVPVQGYTDAYANSGVSGWLSWLYGMVAGAFLFLVNALRGMMRMIGGADVANAQRSPIALRESRDTQREGAEKKDDGRSALKLKTLHDTKDGEDDRQFYNGNQLNFEPRPEDEDQKDE
ncbi:MAG: hypothetical protein M1822_000952 [Bathelium mastoideum]|nr:MAG: hypothetical protein M1822_000952 [Bathelium mastoideum]